jgi:hypothetical protein
MRDITPFQALILFSWFPLAFTLTVMMLIGRFYQRFSGRQTRWPWLAAPLVLFAAAVVREANVGMAADVAAYGLYVVASVLLLALVLPLYRAMMATNPENPDPRGPLPVPLLVVIGSVGVIVPPAALAIFVAVLGRFSHRMHYILQGRIYHYGYYAAAGLLTLAAALRIAALFVPVLSTAYSAALCAGIIAGAVMAWRSWSWLLAERE